MSLRRRVRDQGWRAGSRADAEHFPREGKAVLRKGHTQPTRHSMSQQLEQILRKVHAQKKYLLKQKETERGTIRRKSSRSSFDAPASPSSSRSGVRCEIGVPGRKQRGMLRERLPAHTPGRSPNRCLRNSKRGVPQARRQPPRGSCRKPVARYLMELRNRRPNTRRAPQQHVSSNYSRRQARPRPAAGANPFAAAARPRF